jgi:hypothetical protein
MGIQTEHLCFTGIANIEKIWVVGMGGAEGYKGIQMDFFF